MGYGSGTVEVPFGPEILREHDPHDDLHGAAPEGRHLGLLFYADGESPVSAQLVFPGLVLPRRGALRRRTQHANCRSCRPSPKRPTPRSCTLDTTIGPSHITYYEYLKGHFIPYHPRGIRLPRTCPHGGFRFAAQFAFENGAHASAHAAVPCPRR